MDAPLYFPLPVFSFFTSISRGHGVSGVATRAPPPPGSPQPLQSHDPGRISATATMRGGSRRHGGRSPSGSGPSRGRRSENKLT